MRRSRTPYVIKRFTNAMNRWYIKRFIAPQFDALGTLPDIAQPRHLHIFGRHIRLGKFAQIVCEPDANVRLTTWPHKAREARITIGDYCLIAPGVKIAAANSIQIGDNCMIAAHAVISDSDWHGVYNRIRPFRCTAPVTIDNNVWIGERAIILKGAHIGENSIIGAGAVVTKSIPANVIAAGNPARVIKPIQANRKMLKRDALFRDPAHYYDNQNKLDAWVLAGNGFYSWIRSLIKPTKDD